MTGSPPAPRTASAYACFSSYWGSAGRAGRGAVSPTSGVNPTTGRRRSTTRKRLRQRPRRPLRIRRVAELADRGRAGGPGARHAGGGPGRQTADGDHRDGSGPPDGALEAGQTVGRRKRCARLGAGLEDRAETEVIRPRGQRRVNLSVGMRGDADQRVLAEHLARRPGGEVLLPEVHSVGARGPAHVGPVVDQQQCAALPAGPDRFARHLAQLPRRHRLQAELDDCGAAAEEGLHQLQRGPRRRAVDDGVQAAQMREPPLLELPHRHRAFTIAHDVLSCPALRVQRSMRVADKQHDLPPKYLDRRVVERYVKKGLVDEKEYARLIKTLPDLAEKAAKVETDFTSADELGPAR